MAKIRSETRPAAVPRGTVPIPDTEIANDGSGGKVEMAGKVAIDRYAEALRKGVMLSQ